MKQFLTTRFGKVAFEEAGSPDRPALLLIHGIPTSSYLWRHVIPPLAREFHCIAPDLLGLGDSQVRAEADVFHMNAQAEMLVELMAGLEREQFAVLCHDQGGAAAQILAARHSDRLTALVLTNCVGYDNWPVPVIRRLQVAARRRSLLYSALAKVGVSEWVETHTPWSSFRRGVYDRRALSNQAIAEYLRPMRESAAGRERFRSFLIAGDPRYTMAAVPGLRRFEKPALVVWAANDAYLAPTWGRRLADDIPGCERLELIDNCGHFWPEEKPDAFVDVIAPFLRAHLSEAKRGRLPVVG